MKKNVKVTALVLATLLLAACSPSKDIKKVTVTKECVTEGAKPVIRTDAAKLKKSIKK